MASTCPIDRTRIKNRKEELVEAPRVVIELLGELGVKCSSCKEEVKREEWERHEVKCREMLTSEKNGKDGQAAAAQGALESPGSFTEEKERVCELCQDPIKLSELAVSFSSKFSHEISYELTPQRSISAVSCKRLRTSL